MSWVIKADAKVIPTEEDGVLCIAAIVRKADISDISSDLDYLWSIAEVVGNVMSIDYREGMRTPSGYAYDLQEVSLLNLRALESIVEKQKGSGFDAYEELEQKALNWGPKRRYRVEE